MSMQIMTNNLSVIHGVGKNNAMEYLQASQFCLDRAGEHEQPNNPWSYPYDKFHMKCLRDGFPGLKNMHPHN